MNKADLVDFMAKETDTSKAQAERLLNAAIKGIKKSLKRGTKVVLVGFGTFSTRRRAARMGRNPRTGAPIKIAAATVPVFKAGKSLKETVKK